MSGALGEVLLEHSFRNFHARGLDYLCLRRTPEHTVKIYFFDGDADLSELPEIVMPHDHRYDFQSTCLAGEVVNREYALCPEDQGERYERFAWSTPLLGGDGFAHVGQTHLAETRSIRYTTGQWWASEAQTVHTLQIRRAGTILRLDQLEDLLPVGVPTNTYRLASQPGDVQPPELAGLYETMDADRAAARLSQYREALSRLQPQGSL